MGLETEHGSNKSVFPNQPKQKWDEKGGVESPRGQKNCASTVSEGRGSLSVVICILKSLQ